MNVRVCKSPSGDRAMCVIPRISLLSRAEGGRRGGQGTQIGDSKLGKENEMNCR